jgi:hypothetical protein
MSNEIKYFRDIMKMRIVRADVIEKLVDGRGVIYLCMANGNYELISERYEVSEDEYKKEAEINNLEKEIDAMIEKINKLKGLL